VSSVVVSPLRRVTRLGLILGAAALLAACASLDKDDRGSQPIPVRLVSEMKSKGMKPKDPVFIRIYKQESELEVWKRTASGRYALMKTYPLCRWSGKLGPKMREGDRQAPEGVYMVSPGRMNPRSQFYLSFDLGFPNKLEKALGYSGNALMVHGACSSSGCYAMSDQGIAEIYPVVREAFAGGQTAVQVQALPFRMNAQNLARHAGDPNMPFWENLKEGVDYFDANRQPPSVAYCGRRYAFGLDPELGSGLDPLGACPAGVTDVPVTASIPDMTAISATGPALAYTDGGMHPSFREILRKSGAKRLQALTSERAEVSRPDAALADPYQP